MRQVIQDKSGQWRMVEEKEGICHLKPVDWSRDSKGHWPRVEYVLHRMGESGTCPCCRESILFNEIEYVFGVCRRDRKDMIFLLRCLHCGLPMRVRVREFVQKYPDVVADMEGWTGWDARQQKFEAEEERLFGKP